MSENADKTREGFRPDGLPVGVPFSSTNQPENPGRKPNGASPKEELKRLLKIVLKGEWNEFAGEHEDMPVARKLALNLLNQAVVENKLDAIKTAFEHVDGKPAQALNLGGQDGENPLVVDGKLVVELVRSKGSFDE
jgi:hypothetical protein